MDHFDVDAIERIIGYKFKNEMFLLEAFTHSSYANENRVKSYERLEFLGDSILGYYVARYLYTHYPKANEGFLTKAKANIVSGKTLAQAIEKLNIIGYMRTSGGSSEHEVQSSSKTKEDLFESIIGAIACDSGSIEECWQFIYKNLKEYLELDYEHNMLTDYKSALLEKARHELKTVEFPFVHLENGEFEVTAVVGGEAYGTGTGHTKKKAEQQASKFTLIKMGIIK